MFFPFSLVISAPEMIGIVCAIIMIACLISFAVQWIKSTKIPTEETEELSEEAPEPVFVKARAVAKRADVEFEGARVVQSEICFIVTFQTEAYDLIELEVPEDVYLRITKDQEGMLMTVNGIFHDFGDGEEIEDKE